MVAWVVVMVAELVVTIVVRVAGMKMILLQSLLGMFEIAHTQQC